MTVLYRTKTVARRHELSPLGHLPAILVVLAIIAVATWFFISQSQNEIVRAPEIQKPSLEQPIFEQGSAVEKAIPTAVVVVEQVEKAPAVEKAIPTAVVVVEQVEKAPAVEKTILVDWKIVSDLSTVPPNGDTEPYTGTVNNFVSPGMSVADGGIPERVAIVQSAMPKRDMSQDFIAIYAYRVDPTLPPEDVVNRQLLIAAINRLTHGPTSTTIDPILFVSDDGGATWSNVLPVPEQPKGNAPIIGEVRRGEKLFISYSGYEWVVTD